MNTIHNQRTGERRVVAQDQMTYADFWRNWNCWLDVLQEQQCELIYGDHRGKPWEEYMWSNQKASEISADITEVSIIIERSNAWTPRHNAN